LLKKLSFLPFGAFVKNKVGIAVWIHIWVLYSIPFVSMSLFFFASAVLFLLLWLCNIV
jgi:hypothetical protein